MTRVFCSIVLLIAAGCSPSGPVLIQGRVFTGPSLFQSTISPGEWFQEEVPLPDCKVWLAFDKEAQDPVEGCETHTVEDGRYQFRVNSNVKPKDTATHEY